MLTARKAQLLDFLRTGIAPTQQELLSHLGLTSRRHVRRLIRSLEADGHRIETFREGRVKRYRLPADQLFTDTQAVHLTEAELLALVVAAQAAQATLHPTPFKAPIRTAFSTLLKHWAPHEITSFEPESEARHWHFSLAPSVKLDPVVFNTLRRAIAAQQMVYIDYFTASKNKLSEDRPIDPLLFATPAGSWVVVAYCHRSNQVKDFALAGVRAVRLSDPPQYFKPPADFDEDLYFGERFKALAGGPVEVVRLRVAFDRAEYFRRKHYHRTQIIETTYPDGSIEVSYEVTGLEEMRAFVQSWGVGVTVLEPPALVQRIREEAEALAERYGSR